MGVSVHIELRDFILIQGYPRGYTCESVIRSAYARGYKESLQTCAVGYDAEKGQPIMGTLKRVRSHMERNFDMLCNETKRYLDRDGNLDMTKISGRLGESGAVVFKEKDKKAYFVPGQKSSVNGWRTSRINLVQSCNEILWRINRGERGPLTYDGMPAKSEGWKNHDERVLKFYLEMFPETDLYTLLEQTGNFLDSNGERMKDYSWPKHHVRMLKELKAPKVSKAA